MKNLLIFFVLFDFSFRFIRVCFRIIQICGYTKFKGKRLITKSRPMRCQVVAEIILKYNYVPSDIEGIYFFDVNTKIYFFKCDENISRFTSA